MKIILIQILSNFAKKTIFFLKTKELNISQSKKNLNYFDNCKKLNLNNNVSNSKIKKKHFSTTIDVFDFKRFWARNKTKSSDF